MNIRENVSLAEHSTMRLGGNARYLVEVTAEDEIAEAHAFAKEYSLPIVTIGSGSNVIWTSEGFNGLVIINRIMGIEILEENDLYMLVRAHAGENWDDFVKFTVDHNLTGVEALSAIPGTCGAAPIQNIGAYGQEFADTVVEVHAYDTTFEALLSIEKDNCQFSYRHSLFNTSAKRQFIITGFTLKLYKGKPQPPYYKDVEAYLNEHDIVGPTPLQLREAVMAIRTIKLPDPSQVANTGSFFHNPILNRTQAEPLLAKYPDIPNWEMNDGRFKFSAAWLIEKSGYPRDTHDATTGMASWKNHAMVLVNEHAHSADDLFAFRDKIVAAVEEKFGLKLQQEPEIITT